MNDRNCRPAHTSEIKNWACKRKIRHSSVEMKSNIPGDLKVEPQVCGFSWSFVRLGSRWSLGSSACRAGRFTNNAHSIKFQRPLRCSAPYIFDIRAEESTVANNDVQGIQLELLSLSDNWVAVNKPSGMLVHRTKLYHSTPGETYLVDQVSLEVQRRLGRETKVFPVQRLDRPTSGVILFALESSHNASKLQDVLQSKDCRKEYWTLAFGADMPKSWVNEHPLRDLGSKIRKQRSAYSEFEQLLSLAQSNISVVRARIATGRRHQIRRHLSNSRYPVVGDTSHGKGELNRKARDLFGIRRCCLHARRISFADPDSGKTLTIEAPVPDDLRQVLMRIPDYQPAAHNQLVDLGDIK